MPIVEDVLKGRLDNYRVSVYDTDDFSRSTLDVQLTSPVKIRYGDLKRNPTKSILKSYTQLTFIDENLELLEEFQGGFKTERYVVEIFSINTNDVAWRGLVKEKARIEPFSQRTTKQSTTLNVYGGIARGRVNEKKAQEQHGAADPNDVLLPRKGGYALSRFTKQVPIRSIGTNGDLGGGEYIRSNVEFKSEETLSWYGVGNVYDYNLGDNETNFYPSPINTVQKDSFWKASKAFNEVYKHIIYKSLSENRVVWEDRLRVGSSSSDIKESIFWPQKDKYESGLRPSHINNVKIEDVTEERKQDGLRDLKSLGDIILKWDQDQQVGYIGPSERNIFNTSGERFDAGVGYINDSSFGENDSRVIRNKGDFIYLTNSNIDNKAEVKISLDEINPVNPLAVVVEWKTDTLNNVDEIQIINNDSAGNVATDSDLSSGTARLIGKFNDQTMQPEVRAQLQTAQGDPIELARIDIKIRWVESQNQIIQSLFAGGNEKGVEPIEIEDPIIPLLQRYNNDDPNGTFDFWSLREPQELRDTSSPRNIQRFTSHYFQLDNEQLLRPPDTKTARFKQKGIFGPEYLHKIEDRDGNIGYYIASGLEINLKTGITDCSLTEVPNHTLA